MLLHLSTASSPAEDFSKFQADMGQRRAAGEAPGLPKFVEGRRVFVVVKLTQKNTHTHTQEFRSSFKKLDPQKKNVKICLKIYDPSPKKHTFKLLI